MDLRAPERRSLSDDDLTVVDDITVVWEAAPRRKVPAVVRNTAIPAAAYLLIYAVMNPYAWNGFSQHFLLDTYDGYQNVWNMWWVRHSVVNTHASPYFTRLLHWPSGVTLVPQTMSPLNGVVGIGLHGIGLGLATSVNLVVIASFVATGLTTFWLLRHLRASWSAALLGGLLFAFSSFHTAQAIGHLQLISLEFVPLFVLAWLRYLDVNTHRRALLAALALFAVILCDYYYAVYCVGIATILLVGHLLAKRRTGRSLEWQPLLTFVSASAITTGALLAALFTTNQHDRLLGAHRAIRYGLDPVSLLLPGGASYWHSLTSGYWHRLLPTSFAETSVYLGSVLIVGLVAAVALRRRLHLRAGAVWWVVLIGFGTLALGPRLRLDGSLHPSVPLPYALFERIVPGFKLSGMPIRMTVVVVLAAVVIVTELVTALQAKLRRPALQWCLVIVLAVVSIVELYPRPVPRAPTTYPAYVAVLRRLPHDVGMIDTVSTAGSALYNQTGDAMPMAYGYVTRLPASVARLDRTIGMALRHQRYGELCTRFRLRWLLTRAARPGLRVVYRGPGHDPVRIYDMQRGDRCASHSPVYAAVAMHRAPITSR